MTALSDLAMALRNGSTLAWCLKHAPDGDADGVIEREWRAETNPDALYRIVPLAEINANPAAVQVVLTACWRAITADEFRAAVPCPRIARIAARAK